MAYDRDEALLCAMKALRRAGVREDEDALRLWTLKALDAHEAYMGQASDDGEYDEDDACEAVLAALEEDGMDEDAMQTLLMKLDAFIEAQVAYLEECELI